MGLLGLFKDIRSISPAEVREVIAKRKPEEYCLLDVRQPAEYAEAHLPGARLIPLGELSARLGELDPNKLTIVYCRSGNRSSSAYSILTGAGFTDAINMAGGILAYNGILATGSPESGMFCFPASMGTAELAAVGWYLEAGLQAFLLGLKPDLGDNLLARADTSSRERQAKLAAFSGPKEGFPSRVLPSPPEPTMPGCVSVAKAAGWARGRQGRDIIELLMSLTANAYDLYLKMSRLSTEADAKKLFSMLSDEAMDELHALGGDLDRTI